MKIWNRAEQTLVGLLGLAALAFALWQVVSRYFFPQGSISYAEEVIVYLVIWAIMIVSSQLVRTDSHVRPDLVLNVVPARVARWMEIFNCVAAMVFCGAADRRPADVDPLCHPLDWACCEVGPQRHAPSPRGRSRAARRRLSRWHDKFPHAVCRTAGHGNAGLSGAGALCRRDVHGIRSAAGGRRAARHQ